MPDYQLTPLCPSNPLHGTASGQYRLGTPAKSVRKLLRLGTPTKSPTTYQE